MSKKNSGPSGGRTVIGKIAGAHGVNGTMLLLPLTDYPDRFYTMKELVIEKPGKPTRTLKVKRLEPYEGKATWFLRADGITDRDAAEELKGGLATIPDSERVELGEDEYWTDDVVGLSVIEKSSGRKLGTVEEIMFTGSNDVYLVRTEEGALKPIPATGEAIDEVDVSCGAMTVTIPEGLWD